jgi:hypothetical protein
MSKFRLDRDPPPQGYRLGRATSRRSIFGRELASPAAGFLIARTGLEVDMRHTGSGVKGKVKYNYILPI